MGIKQFFKIKIFNKKSTFDGKTIDSLGEVVSLKQFKGKRLCNDASLMIYQSILSQEHNNLTDQSGKSTVHITTILNKVLQQNEAGIDQIWIFDSPIPNPMKKKEMEKRKERREKGKGDHKLEYKLTTEHVQDIQRLLELLGIMYIIAPPGVEAECYGSHLCHGIEGFCMYMISSDSDVLFFGGNLLKISTQKSATGKSKKTIYQTFNLENVLSELGLTYDQFLTMGVALGSDWNEPNEQGIGPGTVMKKLNEIYLTPSMKDAIEYYKQEIDLGKAEVIKKDFNMTELLDYLKNHGFNVDKWKPKLDKFNANIL